jgi:MFS family permease
MRLPGFLRSLRRRDLRLFFGGQAISLVGTWMQSVARSWLVFRLTGSSEMLGVLGFAGQIPVFVLGIWAGTLADRVPRRAFAIATQVAAAGEAGILAWLTLSGRVAVWHLLALAALLGVITAFDIPVRQAYLTDMAGDDLQNAIALNSTIVNGARVLGPALAGYVVAGIGEGMCFLVNALSYIPVIVGLAATHAHSARATGSARRHLVEGLAYAARTPHARALLLLVALASLAGMPYVVLMPVFAGEILRGGPELLGTLLGAAGVGATIGALGLLRLQEMRGLGRRVAWGSTFFAIGLGGVAISRRPIEAEIALLVVGWGFMTQLGASNTLLQGLAPPEMRGRIMGLYSMAFIGLSPFGALAIGALAGRLGPRLAVAIGALLLGLGSAVFHARLAPLRKRVLAEFPHLFAAGGGKEM